MRTVLLRTIACSIAALCGAAAWGQTPAEESHALFFKESPKELLEITGLIGAITNGARVSMDPDQGTVIVRGTAEQVKLAEWLAKEIAKPGAEQPSQQSNSATPEYVA